MDDRIDLFLFQNVLDEIGGEEIALDELVVRRALNLIEIAQAAAIVKLVKVDNLHGRAGSVRVNRGRMGEGPLREQRIRPELAPCSVDMF